MDFITSQQQPIETGGSHLIGVVEASYNMIKTAFGDACGGDGYKTQVEWAIQFEDGTIATIYDWKEGDCYHGEGQGTHFSKVEEWHIGGFNDKAELRVLEVLTGIQDMVNTGTPLEDIPPRVLHEDTNTKKFNTRVFFNANFELEVEADDWLSARDRARDIACDMTVEELMEKLNLSYDFVEVFE
jgi:hypothetical protein